MELPKTNFFPPFNITRASHLVLTPRDLATSRDFYTEVIGLIVTDETGQASVRSDNARRSRYLINPTRCKSFRLSATSASNRLAKAAASA